MSEIKSAKVISLPGSDRILGFKKEINKYKFNVFDAFDGRFEKIPEFYSREKYFELMGEYPSPGEIGCAVSHFLVMKEFAEQKGDDDDLILIAEDDARIAERYEWVIDYVAHNVDWRKTKLALLANQIGAGKRNHNSSVQKLAILRIRSRIIGWSRKYPFMLGNVIGHTNCAGLYLVSRGACQEYVSKIKSGEKIFYPADFFHLVFPDHWRSIKVVRPGIADFEGESTIGGDSHDWKNFRQGLRTDGMSTIERIRLFLSPKLRIKTFIAAFCYELNIFFKGRA